MNINNYTPSSDEFEVSAQDEAYRAELQSLIPHQSVQSEKTAMVYALSNLVSMNAARHLTS